MAWNQHESCRVEEGELAVVRCREGWVLRDQESWDRVNRAAEAGRRFKKEFGGGETKGKGKMKMPPQMADSVTTEAWGSASPAAKEAAKRKVVRAGDETETDISARRK